jgi:hypothetical protein
MVDHAAFADGSESDDAVPAGPTSFTVTASDLEHLAREVAATYPGQRIVGWYHSHPRFGIFLSAHDLYIHSAFFAQSWQVGYVYDPVQAQRGFFGWAGREVVRVPQWQVTSVAHASGAELPVNAPVRPPDAAAATIAEPSPRPTPPLSNRAAAGAPIATETAIIDPPPSAEGEPPSRKQPPVGAIVAAVVAVIALIVAAIIVFGGDDDDATTADTDVSAESSVATSSTVAGVDGTTAASTATSVAAPATDVTTTTTTAGSDVPATEPAAITFPATPTGVTPPAARVGESAVACVAGADGAYAPTSDCYVPLDNGNVIVFVAGSLRCVDPAGDVVAEEAQSFTIGVDADPIVLVADGELVPTCVDLTYAKNVLSGGDDTFDGLCGSSGTQINDGTRRCIAHNGATGAMAAIVRGVQDDADLVVSCSTGGSEAAIDTVTWSDTDVSTAWRVDAVVYQQDSNDFLATASRNGSTATATFGCG